MSALPSRQVPLISAAVYDLPVSALVDTGSAFTLVSDRVFSRACETSTCTLRSWDRPPILAASNDPLHVLGTAEIKLKIGSHSFLYETAVVRGLPYQLLLGSEVLQHLQASISYKTSSLCVRGESVPFQRVPSCSSCSVRMTEQLIVPARSSILLSTQPEKNLPVGDYLIDPSFAFYKRTGLLVARSITDSKQPVIQITNSKKNPVTVRSGTLVAYMAQLSRSDIMGALRESSSSPADTENLIREAHIGNLTEEQKIELLELLKKNFDIFARDIKNKGVSTTVKHHINTQSAPPVTKRPYRQSPSEAQHIRQQVAEMVTDGTVRPSKSPWAAPVVLVQKKDGTKRFCVDYRGLNAVTVKDVYPLPRIDDTLDALSMSAIFSKLDFPSGYWQIDVAEEDKEKTAFAIQGGLFEFNRMPFGLTNAPATFQRAMDVLLTGLAWQICLVYLDDIIIFSKDFDEHLRHLQLVFDRIRDGGFHIKPSKCYFGCESVTYLGHVVSANGIQVDPEKVRAVQEN